MTTVVLKTIALCALVYISHVATAYGLSLPVVNETESCEISSFSNHIVPVAPFSNSSLTFNQGISHINIHIINRVVDFPKMPARIRAILHEDWNELDPRGGYMIAQMAKVDAAVEFAHARGTFFSHMQGTFSILGAWGQPEVVRRTGLVHTAYSGDLFQFYLFDATDESERSVVKSLLGKEAEALTYLFGTINRGQLCDLDNVLDRTHPGENKPIPISGPQIVDHRIHGSIGVSEKDAANILMVTIADYLDQMVETNGWRDHHMVDAPEILFPGDGRPAVALYWMSSVCNAIKVYLDVVPPIFDHCMAILEYSDELAARDQYWDVVLNESKLTEDEQINLLLVSIGNNPFVGEPHIMLSQIYYRQGRFYEAATHAASALEKLYTLASAWDKRRSYGTWVGFARILLLRSNRSIQGIDSLPKDYSIRSAKSVPLISLSSIFEEMGDKQ